jgi:hypothetical protein
VNPGHRVDRRTRRVRVPDRVQPRQHAVRQRRRGLCVRVRTIGHGPPAGAADRGVACQRRVQPDGTALVVADLDQIFLRSLTESRVVWQGPVVAGDSVNSTYKSGPTSLRSDSADGAAPAGPSRYRRRSTSAWSGSSTPPPGAGRAVRQRASHPRAG